MKRIVIALGWLVLACLFGLRVILEAQMYGKPVNWSMFGLTVSGIMTWLVLTPVLFQLCRRLPFSLRPWWKLVLGHLACGLAIIFVDIAVYVLLDAYVFGAGEWAKGLTLTRRFLNTSVYTFPFSVFYYVATIGICHAFDYHQLVRDRELKASQLETRLAQAHLQALRMQLQPHFLFNTLNAISELLHSNPEAADRMITRLSDLLRLTLRSQGRQEVPLKEELDLLRSYVEIELVRFRDRLTVDEDIAPEALDALVPTLMLQPLVENAIRHGIQPRSGSGHIRIAARPADHKLRIDIQDDGRGLPARAPLREGVGLANTRERLQHLYGNDHRFDIRNAEGGGVQVTLAIPFRSAVVAE